MIKFLPRVVVLVCCFLLSEGSAIIDGNHHEINIVLIAPENDSYSFCLDKVIPALHAAIETSQLSTLFQVNISTIDSHFPDEISMWTVANEYIYNRTANLFLGPMYDYALELLARISAQDSIAVMSPGGFGVNLGLHKKTEPKYATLIRMTTTMHKLITYLIMMIVDEYRYKKIKFISEKHDSDMFFCRQFDEALKYIMNMEKNRRKDPKFGFDLYMFPRSFDTEQILRTEVGNEYVGKFC
ncbi:Nitrogen permease regulator 2 [Mactra antiquata]